MGDTNEMVELVDETANLVELVEESDADVVVVDATAYPTGYRMARLRAMGVVGGE